MCTFLFKILNLLPLGLIELSSKILSILEFIVSILIVCIFINGGLNTLWLVLTSKKAFLAILPTRVIKQLLMIPIMFVTMVSLTKLLTKQINEVKND